jgi:tetratricopeptide (TPR) repeat protein
MKKINISIIILLFSLFCFSTFSFGQTATDYIKKGIETLGSEDYIGAIKYFNTAIELDPNNSDAYHLRAMAKFKLKDYRGTIIDCNTAILLDQKNADAFQIRGLAKYNLGDVNGACLDMSKAGELGNANSYEFIKNFCN